MQDHMQNLLLRLLPKRSFTLSAAGLHLHRVRRIDAAHAIEIEGMIVGFGRADWQCPLTHEAKARGTYAPRV
jgi:hypothetical protein